MERSGIEPEFRDFQSRTLPIVLSLLLPLGYFALLYEQRFLFTVSEGSTSRRKATGRNRTFNFHFTRVALCQSELLWQKMETVGYDPTTEPCRGSVIPDFTMSPYLEILGVEPRLQHRQCCVFPTRPYPLNYKKRILISSIEYYFIIRNFL